MSEINYAYQQDQVVNDMPETVQETTQETTVEAPAPADEQKPVVAEKPAERVESEKPAEVTVQDWKDVIKTADKYEALKELGYDDFTVNMLKYREQTGDFVPYLQAKTVDYSKMTPVDLIKIDLQRQNPGMLEKAFNFKLNKELEKYYLNREDYPEDSDEAIYGQEQLRLDGEAKRKAFIEEQEKFTAPEPQPDLEKSKRDAELQQQRATLEQSVMNNPATVNLLTAKSISYGEGEESFHYPVADPQAIIDTAKATILNSGEKDLTGVDMLAFYKQLAKAQDGWEKAFADHHQAVARKKFESGLSNVTPVTDEAAVVQTNTRDYAYRTS